MLPVLIKLLISVLIPWVSGGLILNKLLPRKLPLFAFIGISFGLGFSALTHSMLLVNALGLHFDLTSIYLLLGLIMLIICFIPNSAKIKNLKAQTPPLSRAHDQETPGSNSPAHYLALLIKAYIIFGSIMIFTHTFNLPITGFDPIATSTFKAKIFFYEHSLEHLKYAPHPSFPLHVSFLQTWVDWHVGEWSDFYPKIVFPLTFISLLFTLYFFIRLYTDKLIAMIGCGLLFNSNMVIFYSTLAYKDITLLYYFCLSIIFLVLWHDLRDEGYLWLAALFTGFTTFIKLEGVAYLPIAFTVLLFYLYHQKSRAFKDKCVAFFKFAIPSLGICALYTIYKIATGVNVNDKSGVAEHINYLDRAQTLLHRYIEDTLRLDHWGILWVVLALSLLINFRKILNIKKIQVFLISLTLFFVIHFTFSLVTDNFYSPVYTYTLPRLLLHNIGFVILLIVFLNAPNMKDPLKE